MISIVQLALGGMAPPLLAAHLALAGMAPVDAGQATPVAQGTSAAAPGGPGSQIGEREWLRRFGPQPAVLPVAAVATAATPLAAERTAAAIDDKRRARRRREEELLLMIAENDT